MQNTILYSFLCTENHILIKLENVPRCSENGSYVNDLTHNPCS